jgi:hypothetical protein
VPERERALPGSNGVLHPAKQRHLVGEPVVQPGRQRRVSAGREAHRPLELRRGFPV